MEFRVATFNLESLDEGGDPPLDVRIRVLRPQLLRLRADILCLQEVHGQRSREGGRRELRALDRLLEGTPYADYHRATTLSPGRHRREGWVADIHNLVILSRFPIREAAEIRHQLVDAPVWRAHTARPPEPEPERLVFDRPFLHARIEAGGRLLHVVNLHLRAPLAVPIAGQREKPDVWRSCSAWAEGFFMASMKRDAQALEARFLVDRILDEDPEAFIIVAGDLNADSFEVPVRILLAEPSDTGNGRLAPRALVPLERRLPIDRRYSVIHHGRRVLLDHILVSRPLLACFRHIEIHSETLEDEMEAWPAVAHGSDSHHAPLVARFELDPGTG